MVLHLLGTGACVSDPHRTVTMLAVENESGLIAVDCGGDMILRMYETGLEPHTLQGLFVTHAHPDHISGLPLLIQRLWLGGRTARFPILGPKETLTACRTLLRCFELEELVDTFEIQWRTVSTDHESTIDDIRGWKVVTIPTVHSVESIGLKFIDRSTNRTVTYSSDTEPIPTMVEFSRGTNILVHEANGDLSGHTGAVDAAKIGRDAQAGRLLLVHLPPSSEEQEAAMCRAREIFPRTEAGGECESYLVT